MLGRLEMTISECIEAYLSLSNDVFQKKNSRLSITTKVRGRFDEEDLARIVKRVVAEQGLSENALLKSAPDKCKVYGTFVSSKG